MRTPLFRKDKTQHSGHFMLSGPASCWGEEVKCILHPGPTYVICNMRLFLNVQGKTLVVQLADKEVDFTVSGIDIMHAVTLVR